jgi:hypothetical protein
MRIEYDVLKNIDIDCFFRVNNIPIFIATNGGFLPNELNEEEKLIENAEWVSSLPDINRDKLSISINWEYVHKRLAEQDLAARKSYLYSFRRMARKGFYAYDRDIQNDNFESYKLIAWPTYQQLSYPETKKLQSIEVSQCKKENGILWGFCLMKGMDYANK